MGVHDCLLPRAAVCTDPLLARDWLDREDRRFDEIPAALDPAAEFRKRELADVLLRMKPEFQEFPLQYGEIAAFEKISPDEARRKYRQIEINGPGLQFTFCDQHVTIGVYSTVDTDELQAILAVLSAEGGFVLFDPQQNDFVDLQE